tara:strand:+ start:178333 stop:178614 length:282 start_codon:yes stop_codon:yes gene_type:complete
MKELPNNVQVYKQTPTFNQDTVPIGLLKAHTTKAGTWGKICINKGKLLYTIEAEPYESIELSPSTYGVVEPEIPHHIKPIGEVEFYVEFLKEN